MNPNITLRDNFAFKAMELYMQEFKSDCYELIAEHSYELADAMMEAREK